MNPSKITYIERDIAKAEDLSPNVRLYLDTGTIKCVAQIDKAGNWTARIAPLGASHWTLDWVADYGFELHEDYAAKLFPICKAARLNYIYAVKIKIVNRPIDN